MNSKEYINSYLLKLYHQFYLELMRLKNMAQTGNWVYSFEEEIEHQGDPGRTGAVSSSMIFQRLVRLLNQQEKEAAKKGGDFGVKLYNDARYIMCAVSDEVFLTLKWTGQENWSKSLLETRFYGTNAGGELFYKKINEILQKQDPVYSEIAIMYLYALSLGFRGKFHGVNDEGQINTYKQRLYQFLYKVKPSLDGNFKMIFPEAYRHTLEKKNKIEVPGIRRWYGILAGTFTVILAASFFLWERMTTDLNSIVLQILG